MIGDPGRAFHNGFAYGPPGGELRHLRHVAHAQPASQRQLAAIGSVRAGQNAQQGSLARPVRPDEPYALALGQGKADAVEQRSRAERLGQVLGCGKDRHGGAGV